MRFCNLAFGKECAYQILVERTSAPLSTRPQEKTSTGGGALEKQKAIILCIDDDGAGLEARKELLEISGYKVLTAQSGEQGLGLFASHPIDAVVLDYKMPEMNGDRVARLMRCVKPDVPILMLSGYSELPTNELGCVDAFLSKGEPWSTVVSTLDRLLNLRFPFFVRWLEDWKHQLTG
jgi:CheY-like chemotaxis protein